MGPGREGWRRKYRLVGRELRVGSDGRGRRGIFVYCVVGEVSVEVRGGDLVWDGLRLDERIGNIPALVCVCCTRA